MHQQELGATEWLANLSIGAIVLAAFVLTCLRVLLAPSRSAIARSTAELLESLIIAGVLVFLVIRPFFVQAFFIPSESMEPTLMGHNAGLSLTGTEYTDSVHDHIFVNKLIYRVRQPSRGDIIVFRAEKKADKPNEAMENVLIKRCVGIPGDTLEIKEDAQGVTRLFRNNVPLIEPYIRHEKGLPAMDRSRMTNASFAVDGPVKLGKDELFVMGDNRNNSNDSRYWGTLPRNRVIGKASLIFWPLNRLRLIR